MTSKLSSSELADRLAEAVAEYYYERAKEDSFFPDDLRFWYDDMMWNLKADRGAPMSSSVLKNQKELASYLREMSPTREVAQDNPKRLREWWETGADFTGRSPAKNREKGLRGFTKNTVNCPQPRKQPQKTTPNWLCFAEITVETLSNPG